MRLLEGANKATGDNSPHCGTRVGYDPTWRTVYIDRRHSGDLIVGPRSMPGHDAPIRLEDGRIKIRKLLDRSSIELFAEDGVVTTTDLIYPRD